jgi:hypothetical protein
MSVVEEWCLLGCLLICADMILLGDYIGTTRKITSTLIGPGKEVGVEVNADKAKYMLLSHSQNIGQNRNIIRANKSCQSVAQFKYLGRHSSDACYHSVQTFFLLPAIQKHRN